MQKMFLDKLAEYFGFTEAGIVRGRRACGGSCLKCVLARRVGDGWKVGNVYVWTKDQFGMQCHEFIAELDDGKGDDAVQYVEQLANAASLEDFAGYSVSSPFTAVSLNSMDTVFWLPGESMESVLVKMDLEHRHKAAADSEAVEQAWRRMCTIAC